MAAGRRRRSRPSGAPGNKAAARPAPPGPGTTARGHSPGASRAPRSGSTGRSWRPLRPPGRRHLLAITRWRCFEPRRGRGARILRDGRRRAAPPFSFAKGAQLHAARRRRAGLGKVAPRRPSGKAGLGTRASTRRASWCSRCPALDEALRHLERAYVDVWAARRRPTAPRAHRCAWIRSASRRSPRRHRRLGLRGHARAGARGVAGPLPLRGERPVRRPERRRLRRAEGGNGADERWLPIGPGRSDTSAEVLTCGLAPKAGTPCSASRRRCCGAAAAPGQAHDEAADATSLPATAVADGVRRLAGRRARPRRHSGGAPKEEEEEDAGAAEDAAECAAATPPAARHAAAGGRRGGARVGAAGRPAAASRPLLAPRPTLVTAAAVAWPSLALQLEREALRGWRWAPAPASPACGSPAAHGRGLRGRRAVRQPAADRRRAARRGLGVRGARARGRPLAGAAAAPPRRGRRSRRRRCRALLRRRRARRPAPMPAARRAARCHRAAAGRAAGGRRRPGASSNRSGSGRAGRRWARVAVFPLLLLPPRAAGGWAGCRRGCGSIYCVGDDEGGLPGGARRGGGRRLAAAARRHPPARPRGGERAMLPSSTIARPGPRRGPARRWPSAAARRARRRRLRALPRRVQRGQPRGSCAPGRRVCGRAAGRGTRRTRSSSGPGRSACRSRTRTPRTGEATRARDGTGKRERVCVRKKPLRVTLAAPSGDAGPASDTAVRPPVLTAAHRGTAMMAAAAAAPPRPRRAPAGSGPVFHKNGNVRTPSQR